MEFHDLELLLSRFKIQNLTFIHFSFYTLCYRTKIFILAKKILKQIVNLVSGSVLFANTELSYDKWQLGEPLHQFNQWNSRNSEPKAKPESTEYMEEKYKTFLLRKYLKIWRSKAKKADEKPSPVSYWLPRLLFCQWSQAARKQVCEVMIGLATTRKSDVIRSGLKICFKDHNYFLKI